MGVNWIIECPHTECPYNYEEQCEKEEIYMDDSECIALAESEGLII